MAKHQYWWWLWLWLWLFSILSSIHWSTYPHLVSSLNRMVDIKKLDVYQTATLFWHHVKGDYNAWCMVMMLVMMFISHWCMVIISHCLSSSFIVCHCHCRHCYCYLLSSIADAVANANEMNSLMLYKQLGLPERLPAVDPFAGENNNHHHHNHYF